MRNGKELAVVEAELKMFEMEERRGNALAHSAFFPKDLKGDIASAIIVQDLANRMNISVMEVAQSVYIIYGRPSFSTQFIVARLNQSGLIKGSLKTIISDDKQSCYCKAIDSATGEENIGMTITMKIAEAEGWSTKNGSKWQTMPELMLRKRSQSFFIKEFYPQVLFGMQTQEELIDIEVAENHPKVQSDPMAEVPTSTQKANTEVIIEADIEDNMNVKQEDFKVLWTNATAEQKQQLKSLFQGRAELSQDELNARFKDCLKIVNQA